MKTITTNVVERPQINYDRLDQDYDLFRISCKEKYPPKDILNKLSEDNPEIKAVSYKNATDKDIISIYVLAIKNALNEYVLMAKLKQWSEKISKVESIQFIKLKPYLILNILLCLLISFNVVKGSNLLGRLFINSGTKAYKKVVLNEVLFNKDFCLKIHSRHFTKLELFMEQQKKHPEITRRLDNFGKGGLGNSERYQIDFKNNTIEQVASCYKKGESLNLYLMRPLKKNGKENNTPIVKLYGTNIEDSKIGIAYLILEKMNQQFSKYISPLEFKKINVDVLRDIESQIKHAKDLERAIRDAFSNQVIYLKNLTEDKTAVDSIKAAFNDTKRFYPATKKELEPLHVKVIDEEDATDKPTLVIIHEKQWYENEKQEGQKDQYPELKSKVVQHLTLENVVNNNSTVALLNAVKELVIKKMLNQKSTLGWENLVDLSDFVFFKFYKDNQIVLEYNANGSNFNIKKLNPFLHKYLYQKFVLNNNAECIIKDKRTEMYYAIKTTGVKIVPNEKLYRALKQRKTNVRSVNVVEDYYGGLVDINYYMDKNDLYYNVGNFMKGVDKSLSKASIMRQIHPLTSDGDIIEPNQLMNLLKSMSMTWVKFKHYTVLPYPIKLLNEYYAMNFK